MDGTVRCWGGGSGVAAAIAGVTGATDIAVLGTIGCANNLCWGPSTVPPAPSGAQRDGVSYSQYCDRSGTSVTCTGSSGTRGCGDFSCTGPVVRSDGMSLMAAHVSFAGNHGCIRTTTDELVCWGNNMWGQIGLGHMASAGYGTHTLSVPPVRDVSVAAARTCIVTTDGRVGCVGSAGDGTTTSTSSYAFTSFAAPAVAVSVGQAGPPYYVLSDGTIPGVAPP
jgi:hypothetical protein